MGFFKKLTKNNKNIIKSFGNIEINTTFVSGLRLQPDAPGRFPDKKQKIMATTVTIVNNGKTNQYFVNGVFEKNYKKAFTYAVVDTARRAGSGQVETHIEKLSNNYNDCFSYIHRTYLTNPEIVEIK